MKFSIKIFKWKPSQIFQSKPYAFHSPLRRGMKKRKQRQESTIYYVIKYSKILMQAINMRPKYRYICALSIKNTETHKPYENLKLNFTEISKCKPHESWNNFFPLYRKNVIWKAGILPFSKNMSSSNVLSFARL